jgi:hypothetical protein
MEFGEKWTLEPSDNC